MDILYIVFDDKFAIPGLLVESLEFRKEFGQNTTPHDAHITDFDEATMTEIVQLVAGWVYAADAE